MAGSLLLLPVMDALAKVLSARLPVVEIAWARFTIHALLVLPWAWRKNGASLFATHNLGLQICRGLLLAVSGGLFFLAVSRMPLADTMTVFFAYPLVLLILSAWFSDERPIRRQWFMAGCGFGGVLLVVQPSLHGVMSGTPYALGAASFYALGLLVTRKLARRAEPLKTTALSALVGAAGYSVLVPPVFVLPTHRDEILLVLIGAIACLGHLGIVWAHRHASAASLAPVGYTEIVSATFLSVALFHTVPTLATSIGIGLVVVSGIVGSWPHRERPLAVASGEPLRPASSTPE